MEKVQYTKYNKEFRAVAVRHLTDEGMLEKSWKKPSFYSVYNLAKLPASPQDNKKYWGN